MNASTMRMGVGRARTRVHRSVDAKLVACAVCALVVGVASLVTRDGASFALGKYNYRHGGRRETRLLTLSTACSPLELLRFDVGDWQGEVGARIALKGLDNELLFSYAKEMRETMCGTYEVNVTIAGEQSGFFLYPKRYHKRGEDQSQNTRRSWMWGVRNRARLAIGIDVRRTPRRARWRCMGRSVRRSLSCTTRA